MQPFFLTAVDVLNLGTEVFTKLVHELGFAGLQGSDQVIEVFFGL